MRKDLELGDYVEVINDPLVPIHNKAETREGFAGKIVDVFQFDGKRFYRIKAENYGPHVPGTKARAWVRGNYRALQAEAVNYLGSD